MRPGSWEGSALRALRTRRADCLLRSFPSTGASTMFVSSLSTRRASNNQPRTFRPALESLDDRIVPAIGTGAHFLYATSSIDASGSLVVDFKEAGLGNI